MKNNKQKVSDTLSGGPRQGHNNMHNRGTSNTGSAAYGNTSRSAGLTRQRDARPNNDEQMNSALSGRGSPTPDPERRGNINDGGENPSTDRSPSVEGRDNS
jgi:hypothetical protein